VLLTLLASNTEGSKNCQQYISNKYVMILLTSQNVLCQYLQITINSTRFVMEVSKPSASVAT